VSYRLERGEGVADGVRRIVAEELDDAIGGLRGAADKAGPKRDAAIHEARKSLKKSRSALRLVRADLPASVRRAENVAMRDAARRLSGARDAQVQLDTLGKVVARSAPVPRAEHVRRLRAALEARRDELQARMEGDAGVLTEVADELAAIRARVETWPLTEQGTADVAAGIARMYEQGRLAMRAALRGTDDEDWHDWRKRVKDVWYAGRILAPLAPAGLGGVVQEADALSDALGDHNDLAVLLRTAQDEGVLGLVGAITARRDALRRVAAPIGRRLYAERPRAFARRVAALLEAEEAEQRAAGIWLDAETTGAVRALLALKAESDLPARRRIDAAVRRRGLRVSDVRAQVPRRAGGFTLEDFEDLVGRGVVRVGEPPDPATLAGL
jgi:CHAD domain-containing protein